ncbi:MAG: hypothetical protein ACFFAN_13450 [Promethearchaeota archaeon]
MTKFQKFKQIKNNGKIDLKAYARILVNGYREDILKARRELGFNPKQIRLKDFVIKADEIKDIEEIASAKGRSKYFWHGIVYEIAEILPVGIKGQSIAGFTKDTLTKRWTHYVKNTLLKPAYRDYGIHKLIYDYLNNFGLDYCLKGDGKYNWRKIFAILENRFQRNVKEIYFDDLSLRQAEKNYIIEHNLISEGLNIKSGGEGGPKIDLPMLTVAFYIALGYDLNEIQLLLMTNHGINCCVATVSNRISDYWNSFERAQVKFLKPMLEIFIKARFKLYEINDAYGRFMHERIKVFFGGKTFSDLIKIIEEDWSDIKVLKKIPKWANQGKVKQKIPVDILKNLILRYPSARRAALDENIQKYLFDYNDPIDAFYYQVEQQLGYNKWKDARNAIIVPFIIDKLRKDISGKEIFMAIGYKKSSAKEGHNTLCRRLFFGMSTEKARKFFKNHPWIKILKDFEKFYRNKYLSKNSNR